MNVVAYGGGTNSTALLIECVKRGIQVDLILFADTAGEKPHTYKYIDMFSEWLASHNYPSITKVKAESNSKINGLEAACLKSNSLPSIAYGFKSCSVGYKIEPADKYLKVNFQDEWKSGEITKLIGFDAGEPQRAKPSPVDNYHNIYYLIEWDMGRDECVNSIKNAGLHLPGKSACFFCPSSKPSEVRELASIYPELAKRALAMESNADLTSIKGLGRNWAWKDLLATDDMFGDKSYIQTIEADCGCYDG